MKKGFYNSQELGLARGLSRIDIHVDVYVAGDGADIIESRVDTDGSGTIRLFEVPFFKIPEIDHAIYPKLFKQLKNTPYDLIQVNEENEINNFLVTRQAKKRGIPVIIYQGMYVPFVGRILQMFQSVFDRICLPTLRKTVSLAACKTRRAEAHLQRKGFTRTTVIPVGLDEFPFQATNPQNWRTLHDIPANHEILLYIGIFEHRRNIHFLLDIAVCLRNKPYTFVLAGDGPIVDEIQSRVADETLTNVKLIGKVTQDKLPSLYEQSSLFLLASDYEIYGMVILEAMYFGTAVLSTFTAGPEDIIESDTDGVLFDHKDPVRWADKIQALSAENRIDSMGLKAQKKVKNNLTWSIVAKRYKEHVIDVCTK